MLKFIVFATVLLAAAFAADVEDFESNLIEYEIPIHLRRGILPYPYQETQERVVPQEPTYYGEVYDTIVVPEIASVPKLSTEIAASKLGFIATIVSCIVAKIKAAIVFAFVHAPALILGSIAALGICKFTPICSKLSGVESLLEVQEEFRSLATPERLARAAQFVQKAIKKYNSMQSNE